MYVHDHQTENTLLKSGADKRVKHQDAYMLNSNKYAEQQCQKHQQESTIITVQMSIWSARIMSIDNHGIANMIGLSQEQRSIVRARRRNGSMRLTRPNPRIVNARTTWWPVRPEDRWSFGCFWRTRRVWWCSSFFWRRCTKWFDFFYSVFTSYSYRLAVVLL